MIIIMISNNNNNNRNNNDNNKRPDVVVVDKEEECVIIDIAVPADQNIEVKETEVEKYQELARKITNLWDVKTRTVPIVVCVLGAISIRFSHFLGLLKIDTSMETIQKSAGDSPYPQKSACSVRSFPSLFLGWCASTTGCGLPQILPAIAVFRK